MRNRKTGLAVAALTTGLIVVGIGGASAVGGDNPDIRNQSIGSPDVAKGAIGSSELRVNAAKKGHLAKNSVGWHGEINPFTKDLMDNRYAASDHDHEEYLDEEDAEQFLTEEDIPEGAEGPQGPAGPQGPQGEPGEDGVSGAYTAKPAASVISVAPGETGGTTVTCTEGKVALSGGYEVEGTRPNVAVLRNQPAGAYTDGMFNGWNVQVKNNGDKVATVQAAVVCALAN